MHCILVDSPTLGFERILKHITHIGISIMLKSQGRVIDQNALHLTSITSINIKIFPNNKYTSIEMCC